MEPLYIVDFEGVERAVAFASMKLTETQRNWSTIEREAYAALVALRKYINWIFGLRVTVHSDHDPLLYLTESALKSANLMRWSLQLITYHVSNLMTELN